MILIKNFFQKPIIRQFIKFCLVGSFNAFLDYFIYISLTRLFFFHYLLANLISFFITVCVSFILNKKWTFRDKDSKVGLQYAKFWIMAVCGLGFNELILFLLVRYFNVYDLLAKTVAIGIVLFWNFFVGRYWVFKNSKSEAEVIEKAANNNRPAA